jgi:hypothetical protein
MTWRKSLARRIKVGQRAGTPDTDGYLMVQIYGIRRRIHQWAWLYMTGEWPSSDLDHRDLDRTNNRWGNIRPATESQNAANRGMMITNKSGKKGVCWHKRQQQWVASIRVKGKLFHLGSFDDLESAGVAYEKAAVEHFGEFARFS